MLRKENYVFLTEALVLALHKHIILIPTLQSLIRSQKQPPIIPTVCQNEGKLETIFLKKHVKSTLSVLNQKKKITDYSSKNYSKEYATFRHTYPRTTNNFRVITVIHQFMSCIRNVINKIKLPMSERSEDVLNHIQIMAS
jgi:esterase/lipase